MYAIKLKNQENQWIQINMTLVLNIHAMSVGLEQVQFIVVITDSK